MEMGEPSAVPPPPPPKRSPAGSTLAGTLMSPLGPLRSWPFVLKRNGKPVDQGGLGGTTRNAFEDEAWRTDAEGRFEFKQMPEGYYAVEVAVTWGKPVPLPDGAEEAGVRDGIPEPEEPIFVDEDPSAP